MPCFRLYLPLLLLCAAALADAPISTICIDAETGRVLSEAHADLPRPPASMLKLMQMLLVTEGVESGAWSLDKPITATPHAQAMGGAQVFLAAGEQWPLGHLMSAVAVASANDAAMAVAEGLWGGESAYLKAMNQRARGLGMKDTTFRSVHGLPPDKGGKIDQSTARDMARLARACARLPQVLAWAGQKQMRFRTGEALYNNTNKLLWRMSDCDGLKTGYIRAAKFCVAASATRDGKRLIAVVMGAPSGEQRFALAQELLDKGFAGLARTTLAAKQSSAARSSRP